MNAISVYRKGRKWRVETLVPDRKDWKAIPEKTQTQPGGKRTLARSRPSWVQSATEKRCITTGADGNIFGKDAKAPKLKLSMTQALNLSDEPLMPWPDKFPEHISHTSVWQPSHDRDFLLEPKPDDGPPGTIRLRVRDTRFPDRTHPDLYKLWLDPAAGYIRACDLKRACSSQRIQKSSLTSTRC